MVTLGIGEVDSPTFAEIIGSCRLQIITEEDNPQFEKACKILDDVSFLLLVIFAFKKSKERKLQGPGGVCIQLGIDQTELKRRLIRMSGAVSGVTIESLKKYIAGDILESAVLEQSGIAENTRELENGRRGFTI